MAFTLNNGVTTYTLPTCAKDGIAIEPAVKAVIAEMYSGRLRVRRKKERKRIAIRWPKLTTAENTALEAAYDGCIGYWSTLTLPDGQTFTVKCEHYGWKSVPWFDYRDTPFYDVSLTFEEQG